MSLQSTFTIVPLPTCKCSDRNSKKYFRIYLAISCFKKLDQYGFQIMAIAKLQKLFSK